MPYTLLNSNGHSLRNLNTGTWNNEGKFENADVKIWTFADKNVVDGKAVGETLLKAIKSLESKGFHNLVIWKLMKESEPLPPAIETTVQEPAQEVTDEASEENVNPEVLFEKLNKKCLGCKHDCKQPSIVEPLRCNYEKIAA